METTNTKFKKTILSIALVAGLATTISASAQVLTFDWTGLMTMVTPTGVGAFQNTSYPYYSDPTWRYGVRSQISGTLSIDTVTGSGSATMMPLEWGASGPWQTHGMTLQAIGDGQGNFGTLILGNMLFDWGGNYNVPVSIVWDAEGLIGAVGTGIRVGTFISGTGATPASNGIYSNSVQIGPAPLATTTWNTTLVGPACSGISNLSCIGRNPSGGLPLIAWREHRW